MSVQVGFDLVGVEEIASSMVTSGDRFLRRIYTAGELDESGRSPAALAARFAAKEATMKALRRRDEAIPWRSIEVVSDPDGRPCVRLAGAAAALAAACGVTELALSFIPGRRVAGAIVVAACEP